jgi:hypothetical protein
VWSLKSRTVLQLPTAGAAMRKGEGISRQPKGDKSFCRQFGESRGMHPNQKESLLQSALM